MVEVQPMCDRFPCRNSEEVEVIILESISSLMPALLQITVNDGFLPFLSRYFSFSHAAPSSDESCIGMLRVIRSRLPASVAS